MESISEKIKRLRKSKGYTQKDMAVLLEISQPSYNNIENGASKNLSINLGQNLSQILGISFIELFDISPDSHFDNYQNALRTYDSTLKDYDEMIKSLHQELEQKDLTIQSLNTSRKALIEAIIRYIEEQPGNSIYWILKQGDQYVMSKKEENTLEDMLIDEENRRKHLYDYFLNAGLFTQKELNEVHKKINETYKNIDWEGVFKKLLREREDSKN
jgi:transcriptional regulator with XRE-family HTH domain